MTDSTIAKILTGIRLAVAPSTIMEHTMTATTVRKSRRRIVTARQAANMEFEPWKREAGQALVPDAKTIEEIGVRARLAHGIMLRSKAQLVEAWRSLSDEVRDEFLTDFRESIAIVEEMLAMMQAAECRFLVAASTAELAPRKRAA